MFSGNRRFGGRQGEQILNEEQYLLYEIMKHFLDVPKNPDPNFGPESGLEKPGALWLDRQNSPGYSHLMYKDSDKKWKPIFDDWFKIIKEIRNPFGQPEDPKEGQLWINDNGVLHWFNGSMFVPIKSRVADAVEFDANSFENFLIIDPMKMTGGYIVENLSKLAQVAGGIKEWQPNTLYQMGDIVYWTNVEKETTFYQYEDSNTPSCSNPHTSEANFETELKSGFIKPIELKAQYLIPSETLDKVFIGGFYTDKNTYEKLSDVCLQISLSVYQGKTVATVHVNPIALKNIKKKIIKIEKDKTQISTYSMIKVGPDNTEYYGFKGGFGQLLIKGQDYLTKVNGIQLTEDAVNIYDFVYSISYEFETRIKTPGILYKKTINLSNRTSIWIGQIDPQDKLLIFSQGLCLEDFYYNYDAYDPSGLVIFNGYDENGKITNDEDKITKPLFESKTDISILRFRKKTNIGVFTPEMLDNGTVDDSEVQLEGSYEEGGKNKYIASITIPSDYKQPLVFVQGPNLNVTLKDYTIDSKTGKAIIRDAVPGSAYYIVDAIREDGFNMYVESGVVGKDRTIKVSDSQIKLGECEPLIFVDGFYISTRDLDTTNPEEIKINGLEEGQQYVLLKDMKDENYQLLFDGAVSFTTIPMKNDIDDAVLYIDNALIMDGDSCYSVGTHILNVADNEIRNILKDGVEQWCYYKKLEDEWEPITDEATTTKLNLASAGYSVNTRTINILQNFGDRSCTYYAYKFADNIEKPLIKGYTSNTIEQGDELFYKLDFRHSYPVGENALHVWINGVKQKIKENFIREVDGKKEKIVQGFNIPKPTDARGHELEKPPTAFYIIERTETGEHKACMQEYLTTPIGASTFITENVILAPGVPRVFIDGYRQSSDAYIINNMNTLTFVEPPLTSSRTTIMVMDKNNKPKFVPVQSRSEILVEVRQDYRLREKTIKLTQENITQIIKGATAIFDDTMVFDKNTKLPYELFLSKASEICIYINGAAYGKDYTRIKDQNTIVLSNVEIIKMLRAGDIITFEWR